MKINFILLSCLKTECVHFTGIWRFWFECLTELPSASRMTQTAVRILPYVRSAPDCPSSLTQCWACKEPDRGKDTFIKMVLNWFLLKGSDLTVTALMNEHTHKKKLVIRFHKCKHFHVYVILSIHDFIVSCTLNFALFFPPLSVTYPNRPSGHVWFYDTPVENRCFLACCIGDCVCWEAFEHKHFFIVHFPSAVALAVLICCMCNVLQNGKIKFVLSQSCSINNETRSCQNCLAPCHTCLFAQILTGNGESAMVYACMRFWGSELS